MFLFPRPDRCEPLTIFTHSAHAVSQIRIFHWTLSFKLTRILLIPSSASFPDFFTPIIVPAFVVLRDEKETRKWIRRRMRRKWIHRRMRKKKETNAWRTDAQRRRCPMSDDARCPMMLCPDWWMKLQIDFRVCQKKLYLSLSFILVHKNYCFSSFIPALFFGC